MTLNLELLTELVAFQKYGTLSATAEHLMITQPSVTRGMRRLEEELGVPLFDRHVSNHIKLNDTGNLAAAEAQKLLLACDNFTDKVLNYDRLNHEITIAAIAPGPIRFIDEIKSYLGGKINVSHQNIVPDDLDDQLQNFRTQIVFTDHEIMTDTIESIYVGTEYLGLEIDKFNPLAQLNSVTFKELTGLNFLVASDIGPWKQIVESNIPDASFLYQADLNAMSKISRYTNFPFFFSNLTQATQEKVNRFDNGSRNMVKITDPANKLEFYGAYLKEARTKLQPILKQIIQLWPQ